jgi:UDP-glucuronate decarboxylase
MKNVLISGAAGFLGSHLMLHHLKNGDNVLGVDNNSSSKRDSKHIDEIRKHTKFGSELALNCDITKLRDTNHAINEFRNKNSSRKFDIIYNFACPASPPRYQEIPVETMMTCTVGTKNILDIAADNNAIVVHASTSEIYGDPQHTPQAESYRGCVNSYGPRSCYDEGKRAAEALCFDYLNKHNVDARVVRIFNTYGPHLDAHDGRVVTNFIHQALKGEKLTIYGSGQQGRSFCYVDDLIRGILAMGNLPKNPGTPINIGNPNEFTIHELAQHVIYEVSGRTVETPEDIDITKFVEYKPKPVDDPTQRCPDISLAKNILQWEPKIHLRQGLYNTVNYMSNL